MKAYAKRTKEFVIDLNIILRTPFSTSTRSAAGGVNGCFGWLVVAHGDGFGTPALFWCPLKYANTSPFKMRPCGPVAGISDSFKLFSAASLRTAGVVRTLLFATALLVAFAILLSTNDDATTSATSGVIRLVGSSKDQNKCVNINYIHTK